MKKNKLITIILLFLSQTAFAQWTPSSNGINYSGGFLGIGTGGKSLLGPLHIYKDVCPTIELQDKNARLQMGIACGPGSYSTISNAGDAVIRALGNTHTIIFSMPNDNNDGKSAIKFEDNLNGCIMAVYNNKKIQMNASVRALDMSIENNLSIGDYNNTWKGYGKKFTLSGIGDISSDMWLSKYCNDVNNTDFRVNIGNDNSDKDRFVIGNNYKGDNLWHNRFVVTNSGKVGINVDNPTSALEVNGTIRAKEVKIESTGWADFVFDKKYKLPSLREVESHILKNMHLEGIPSENDVKTNGVDLGTMNVKLLQKVEELTLYVIQQDKTCTTQKQQIDGLIKRIEQLESKSKEAK